MKAILLTLLSGLLCIAAVAQTPILNSYLPSSSVIFLDFDGCRVQGTAWNWTGPIDAQPSGLSSTAITEIFNRVAEDYRIFNINVTTDSTKYTSAPATKRTRVIVTPTYQWYGAAGGVSYVGTFTWGDDTPAWVFSGLLNNNVKNVAEAISHEAGHTLGLQHQSSYDVNCIKTAEYSSGQGTGEISWAPIMGVGYSKNITTWYNGPNAFGCSNFQNDISIIASSPNNIGLKSDDYGDRHTQATTINVIGTVFQASGLINNATDKDVFKLVVSSNTNFKLSAIPQNVGTGNAGANIDIRVSLLSHNGDTLSQYNPSNLLNAGIDTTLTAATYYLSVEGIGNANLSDYGSVGLYALSGTLAGILPIHKLILTGTQSSGIDQLNWTYISDEPLKEIQIEMSSDGKRFSTIATLEPNAKTYSIKPTENTARFYRTRMITLNEEKSYYSNIIAIREKSQSVYTLMNTTGPSYYINAMRNLDYQVIGSTGQIVASGHLIKGANRVDLPAQSRGVFYLRLLDGQQVYSEKLVKQ